MEDHRVTQLLENHRRGVEGALDEAFSIVYDELRRLARYQLHDQRGNTLNTTGLVHELYLKLARANETSLENRAHMLSLSARAMRQIVVDHARSRGAQKRGGDAQKIDFDNVQIAVEDQALWILAVDQALERVREIDERLERVFECRYFAGLTEEESAIALDISVSTVQRDWRRAKAWMREMLAE